MDLPRLIDPRCLTQLGLPTSPLPKAAEVKARWRELAALHHPDRGGETATFAQLHQAYTDALELVTRPAPCHACDGTGRSVIAGAWSFVSLPCATCGGSGLLEAG